MHVRMRKARRVNGEHCESGQVVEVDDSDGRFLVARGFAEEVGAGAKSDPAPGAKGKAPKE